ncbi:MAG: AsmA family protein [Verrucomicrobia bacterium]|nr:AsmA family protein [Verrucomicrobiota bacterium]
MAETNVGSSAPKEQRRWLRVLASVAGLLLVLAIVLFFVATSSGFFTGVILPRVGKAMNATITVSDASIHPFKEVVLKDLKVQTTGTEPLVTAAEVRLRYSLMDIIGGKINVQEVTLASPTVTLVENADGTSNLDPITKGQKTGPKEGKPAAPAKPAKAMQVDFKKFALTGGTIRKVKLYANGNRDLTELASVNVTLDDLKNGQTGKLELSADVKMDSHPSAPGVAGSADAKLTGKFDFAFSADLKPATVKGSVHFLVNKAEGALGELASFGADLDCEMSPTQIKQISVRFARGAAQLGEIRLSGPLDMEKSEGRLALQILSIDKRLLNVAGVKSGLDFGTTTISSSNQIQLTKSGKAITAAGRLDVNQFQVTRAGQTTPQMDLALQYATDVDLNAGNAVLRELVFTGVQKGNPLLRADLSKPMSFAWGAASAIPDSTLNVTVTGFNLADWKPFLSENVSAGTVNAKLSLLSQQGGELMNINGNMQVSNLMVKNPKGESAVAPLEVGMRVDASYHKQVADIRQLQLSLAPTPRATNQMQLTGHVDMTKADAITGNLKLTADALDFTSYYDAFAGGVSSSGTAVFAPAQAPPPAGTTTAASGPQKELEPMKLPFHNFTAEANLRRIYLREVEFADVQAAAKLESGSVAVTPFKLLLNGAPVTASLDADLSVPGFKYALAFNAQAIPLAPLVNSFQPERKGQISGTIIAEANISGIGTTGEKLKKNLKGNYSFNLTNLNLSIQNLKNKVLKTVCEVIVSIPQLAQNPASALGNLGKGILGKGGSGSADDLGKSIINAIVARGAAGSGRIDLQQTTVESPAFKADATGTVTLAAILTNSAIEIPVNVSLERATASRLGLLPANTPAGATYAKLPDFLVMKGTVGDPKKEINSKALISLALQSAGGAVGGSAGSQLQNLAGGLTGKSGTNQAGSQVGGLVQGLGGLLGGKTSAASSAPASQPPSNQSPAANPLNRFLNPKK